MADHSIHVKSEENGYFTTNEKPEQTDSLLFDPIHVPKFEHAEFSAMGMDLDVDVSDFRETGLGTVNSDENSVAVVNRIIALQNDERSLADDVDVVMPSMFRHVEQDMLRLTPQAEPSGLFSLDVGAEPQFRSTAADEFEWDLLFEDTDETSPNNEPDPPIPVTDRKELRVQHRSTMPAHVNQTGLGDAAPPWVAIEVLNIEISAPEMLTYFPKHTCRHGYLKRLYGNGWYHGQITAYVNYARGIEDGTGLKYGTVTKVCSKLGLNYKRLHEEGPRVIDLKPTAWTSDKPTYDYLLADLGCGVVNHPVGNGCGALTKCVLFASAHPEKKYTLYDVPTIMAHEDISKLFNVSGGNPDKQARDDFEALLTLLG